MENTTNGTPENTGIPNNTRFEESRNTTPKDNFIPPYEDPAITNPAELASFPKAAPKADAGKVSFESEDRLVNRKSSPVREGINIAQSDNRPDENGYI